MMDNHTFLITNLTTALSRYKRRLINLTLRAEGEFSSMYDLMICDDKKVQDNINVILLFKGNRLIGWVWGFHMSEDGKRYYDVWVYVKKQHRRKGYGKILYYSMIKHLKNMRRKYRVYPWDGRSESFFKAIGATE